MATTLEINDIMHQDVETRKYYGGTWALDMVPIKKALKSSYKCCFIINSSPSYLMGTHWTCVWIGEKKNGRRTVEHFCSLGMKPPNTLHKLLIKEKRKYQRNKKQLQHKNSSFCGYYCMLYLMCKCRGFGLKKFLDCFTETTLLNDSIVVFTFPIK